MTPAVAHLPVVLDAMGGDHAPGPALQAARVLSAEGMDVLLCGPPGVVAGHGVAVLSSPRWIATDEDLLRALRAKPDASIRVAARAVADGRAAALVSAGPTGAVVAAARLEIGRRAGVRRPVLAARLPTPTRDVVLVDVGAMPEADATALVRSAGLGIAHARASGVREPTLALLNMGSEDSRGPQRVQDAARRLRDVPGFRGSIEPDAVLAGAVDVVVTDGFAGNILLKTIEACRGPAEGWDAAATVLGVRGTVLVAHGAATADHLAHAVRMAARMTRPPHVMPGGAASTARDVPRGSET